MLRLQNKWRLNMPESQSLVLYDVVDRIATMVINRPEQRNAIDAATARAMRAAVDRFEADEEAWVGILTGAGDRAFCAGMDLKAFAAGQGPDIDSKGGFAGLVSYPRTKPLIAAVNGAALGGGCEIVLACDLVVAAESVVLGQPEVKRGIFAGAGGCFRLPRMIPRMRAMEMLLTGDPIDAHMAFELGLVNSVVPGEGLMDAARELARRIRENAPLAVRETLALARAAFDLSEEELWLRSSDAWGRINRTEDAREGPLAFAQKRQAQWKAR
jgi:enoyl-CoA hydratase/carnithine racemase